MYQTVWIKIRAGILSGLIWVQTVSKSDPQTTIADKELKEIDKLEKTLADSTYDVWKMEITISANWDA